MGLTVKPNVKSEPESNLILTMGDHHNLYVDIRGDPELMTNLYVEIIQWAKGKAKRGEIPYVQFDGSLDLRGVEPAGDDGV